MNTRESLANAHTLLSDAQPQRALALLTLLADKSDKTNIEVLSLLAIAKQRCNGSRDDADPSQQIILACIANPTCAAQTARLFEHYQAYSLGCQIFKALVARTPFNADYYCNYAVFLRKTREFTLSIHYLQQALSHAPDHAQLHFNLACVYFQINDLPSAKTEFECCLCYQPEHRDARLILANLLCVLHDYDSAYSHLHQLTCKNPRDYLALKSLGICLIGLGKLQQALNALLTAHQYLQDDIECIFYLGECYFIRQHYEQALVYFKQAYASEQAPPQTLSRLLQTQTYLCLWQDHSILVEKLISSLTSSLANTATVSPLSLMPFTEDNQLIADCARAYNNSSRTTILCAGLTPGSIQTKKIRIGYISSDFNDHPIGFLLGDLFAHHDRTQFEIILFDTGDKKDHIHQQISQACDHVYYCASLSDAALAKRIQQSNIAVLVDLNGMSQGSRRTALFRQPASVQCHFLGNVCSMGSAHYQYYISHRDEMTPSAEHAFAESILYLPDVLFAVQCHHKHIVQGQRRLFGLPEQAFIFGCFAASYRISPAQFYQWMQILNDSQDTVLWLPCQNKHIAGRLLDTAKQCGIETNRLITHACGKLSINTPQACCNVVLDTNTINNFTSSIISYDCCVPVLTQLGRAPHTRKGAHLAKVMGLSELIVDDDFSYRQLACALVEQPEKLHAYQMRCLQAKTDSPLFQRTRYIQQLELAYHHMLANPEKCRPQAVGKPLCS